jgi:beta-N-acetylhexosaminidase
MLSRRTFLTTLAATPLARAVDRARAPVPEELVRLAGTCVMSGWYGRGLPGTLRGLLRRGALGGVLVTRHNFRTREELSALCAEITAAAPADARPLIAADQEGGPVAHLSPPLTSFPSMTALGALDDVDLTHRVGAALGAELRSVGVNFDLAPVLDVRTSPRNTVVLNRTFGRDPEKVARHGRALIDGLTSAGVLACAKHFPGHGDTAVDSHAGLPRVAHDLARLDAVELVPFRACARETPAVMLAHVVYAGVDRENPASLSQRVIEGVLRDHLGYEGVAMSDDLQMAAIRRSHGFEEAAEISMRAGCDLLLIAHTDTVAVRVVHRLAARAERDAALRTRLETAAARIHRMRARLAHPLPPNPYPVSGAAVAQEVNIRLAALPGARPRVATRAPDPTLRR